MSVSDIVMSALIIGGALAVLYRSLWKKQGHCGGCCSAGSCNSVEKRTVKKSCPPV